MDVVAVLGQAADLRRPSGGRGRDSGGDWLYYVEVVLATDWGEGADATWTRDSLEQDLELPSGEVHVWRADLEPPASTVARLYELLSPDERGRAGRFRFAVHRDRYVVGRGLLRTLLGRYLHRPADTVRLAYGAYDKPELAGGELAFNLSHSGPLALYAFGAAGELGIDVELYDPDIARERVAERFFAPAEVAALRALPPAQQARGFLHCWTRKEAFIKARGDGLSLALDSFEVSLAPDAPAELLRTAFAPAERERWALADLSDPQAGYIAALAARAGDRRIRTLQVTQSNHEGTTPGQENR